MGFGRFIGIPCRENLADTVMNPVLKGDGYLMKDNRTETITENRRAFHNFTILERVEVGMVLSGSEVKSIRNRRISLSGSYVSVLGNELWLVGCDISQYGSSMFSIQDTKRNRKLLCHRKEIDSLRYRTEAKGLTIVPLKVYVSKGRIKLEIGIARGKNGSDKRECLKEKDLKRENIY